VRVQGSTRCQQEAGGITLRVTARASALRLESRSAIPEPGRACRSHAVYRERRASGARSNRTRPQRPALGPVKIWQVAKCTQTRSLGSAACQAPDRSKPERKIQEEEFS